MDATERNQLKMKRRTAAREQQVKVACFDVQLLSTTEESHDYEMLGWKNSWLQKDIFNADSLVQIRKGFKEIQGIWCDLHE